MRPLITVCLIAVMVSGCSYDSPEQAAAELSALKRAGLTPENKVLPKPGSGLADLKPPSAL